MNREVKSLFGIKNGRKFHFALKSAAVDEPNIGKMFNDNLANNVNHYIEKGEFRNALKVAFIWEDSNEKLKFWSEIYHNLKDLDEAGK